MLAHNIPKQNSLVLTARCEASLLVRVPSQAEAFLLVPDEFNLRVRFVSRMKAAMLRPIKNQDLSVNRECGDNVWILRLVSCFVDLAGVINLLRDLESDHERLAATGSASKATKLATLLVKIGGVGLDRLWDLKFCNLDVVRLSLRRVRSDEQSVDRFIFVLQVLNVGEPLSRQSWPLKSRALKISDIPQMPLAGALSPQKHVIEERAVLFPRLVLFGLLVTSPVPGEIG